MMARPVHREGVSWLQEAATLEAEQRHDAFPRGVSILQEIAVRR